MKRLAVCVLAAFLFCSAFLPGKALAQTGIKIQTDNVTLTRTIYPPMCPSEGTPQIYAGEWDMELTIHNYDVEDASGYGEYLGGIRSGPYAEDIVVRFFLDGILVDEAKPLFWLHSDFYCVGIDGLYVGDSYTFFNRSFYKSGPPSFTFSKAGNHEILIQIWHGNETQPHNEYSFEVTVVKAEVSGPQANSKVIRALGDNSLKVSFMNGGNAGMRQAVLSVADSSGIVLEPEKAEFGDIDAGESASAEFTVSSPADVTLGTVQVQFSLSFIDYAGVSHEENISAEVKVYRLEPTLTLSVPGEVENGATVEIAAFLRDPDGELITGKNVTLAVGGVELGTFETGSDGAARASYTVTETGTFDVGASFSGSASYDAASDSKTLMVVPTASSPYWILPVILVALLFVVSVAYLKRRKLRSKQKPQK